jgi:hypothetical protein
MSFPVDFRARFVCANNSAVQNVLSYHFVGINTFGREPVQQTMKASLAYLNSKDVIEHFLEPFKREVLSYAEITNERLDALAIFDGTLNINGKTALYNLSASAGAPVYPVFGHYRFDDRDIDDLSLPKKLKGLAAHVFPAFGTKTRAMFDHLIGGIRHLKGIAFMSGLSSRFSTALFSETARTRGPVLIFGGWKRTIAAVLFGFEPDQFSIKYINTLFQDRIFPGKHQDDALKIVYYFISWFHSLYYKTIPEIQYIKERKRLFIKH